MKPRLIARPICIVAAAAALACVSSVAAVSEVRDETWFLRRLRTVEHLPEVERSHTALASTWDRSGGNADGTDYKRIEGATNILMDVSGPGCIHRLFTGGTEPGTTNTPGYLRVDGTRLQVYLDDSAVPLFDSAVVEFFDPDRGPVPAPLAGDKSHGWTYPGCLLPIPYARHCRVQLVNPERRNWGSYWQIAYTTYPEGTEVTSLTWPLAANDKEELGKVCGAWAAIQSGPPEAPRQWSFTKTARLGVGNTVRARFPGVGVIRELRLTAEPATPETLKGLRLTMRWDGAPDPCVDVPAGYFFGHADTAHSSTARFSTLLLGVTEREAYSKFPMPYSKGAIIALRNDSPASITRLKLSINIEKLQSIPANWGRFHARYLEAAAALPDGLRLGPKRVPGHLVLEEQGCGKYVGVILRADWPHEGWWGEGDWMIWTDENAWPPSYHGTGSEEYFNSGWCKFDRKAISGYVAVHPGHPTEYSFHLNDAFQYQKNIRVAVETMGWDKADELIRSEHPTWGTTAFWYELP